MGATTPRRGRHRATVRRPRGAGEWWRLAVGVALVCVAVAAGFWLGWEYVGSNLLAHHRQRAVVDQLHQRWSAAVDAPADRVPAAASVRVAGATAFAIVRIPAFGDDYAVPVLEGVGDAQLAVGFGHFPDTAAPGESGNFVVGAHRVTHGEPLRDMPDLAPGDEVIVETQAATYRYVLDSNTLEVDRTEPWPTRSPLVLPAAAAGLAPQSSATITLVTCASLFHTDERSVAFGHLVGARPTQDGAG